MLLVRWIYQPTFGHLLYPRCNSRSRHIRRLRSHQMNITWWLPHQLSFEEPLSNKLEVISHGNSKSFVGNLQLVQKTMNNEDCHSHLVPMDPLLCKLSPYLCHTMQSIIIKDNRTIKCMGWIYSHLAHRYSHESGHTRCVIFLDTHFSDSLHYNWWQLLYNFVNKKTLYFTLP